MVTLGRQDAAAEAALAVLYERYAGAVYGLAVRMLGDAAAAEEVLQEAFWRVWRYAGNYEPGRVRFVTWLLRIATNLAISEQRKRARRPAHLVPDAPGEPRRIGGRAGHGGRRRSRPGRARSGLARGAAPGGHGRPGDPAGRRSARRSSWPTSAG